MLGANLHLSRFAQWLPLASQSVVFDVGSGFTKILLDGTLVFAQPTCVALHRETGSVVAIGEKAARFFGKTPRSITTIFPVQQGEVADQEALVDYLTVILNQYLKPKTKGARLSGYYVIPNQLSVEGQVVWAETWAAVGLRQLTPVAKSKALFSKLKAAGVKEGVLIDVGDQLTEVGLVSAGNLVTGVTLELGSRVLTENLMIMVKSQEQTDIGWNEAETLKKQLGLAESAKKYSVKGRAMLDGSVKTLSLTTKETQTLLKKRVMQMIEDIELVLMSFPIDALASALENGVYLSGAGSLLPGFSELLAKKLDTTVQVSETADTDLVEGLLNISQAES